MSAVISIITPCYNHGLYLLEAVKNLKPYIESGSIEHIIVDDGSDNVETKDVLRRLALEGHIVIHQGNRGLGAARNAALKYAKCNYILPLDCDNIIFPEVFLKGASILENERNHSVFYTNAEFFGEKNGVRKVGTFELKRLLAYNYIDACALIRRDTMLELGGYREDMPVMGFEDWDLWLRLAFKKSEFYYHKEIGYKYRVRRDSMTALETEPGFFKIKSFIYAEYASQIHPIYWDVFEEYERSKERVYYLTEYLSKNRIKAIFKILSGRV